MNTETLFDDNVVNDIVVCLGKRTPNYRRSEVVAHLIGIDHNQVKCRLDLLESVGVIEVQHNALKEKRYRIV